MKSTKFILFLLFISGYSIISLPSCSKVKGCTDPEAETYNPDAESNDATACIYTRDKFIGEYDGDLGCLGLLASMINGMTTFSIDESSKGSEFVDVTIQSNPVLRLEATVSGSILSVNSFIPGVTIGTGTFDITATGDLTLDNSQKNIQGQLKITLGGIATITDNCNISGTKI